MEAICVDCGVTFKYTSKKKDISRCHKCVKIKSNKEYYKLNADKIKEYRKEYSKEYYKLSSDKIKEYYKLNADKIKEYRKEHYKLNSDKIKEYNKFNIETLSDLYIRIKLGIPASECPPELIELKRAHLQLKRQLKTMQS
jgi:ribosomal protein L29